MRFLLVRCFLVSLLFLGGISGSCANSLPVPPFQVESPDSRLKASCRIAPEKIRLSDTVQMEVDIEFPLDFELQQPEFGDAIGDFSIDLIQWKPLRIEGDRQIQRFSLVLLPQNSGTARVGAIPLLFREESVLGIMNSGRSQEIEKSEYLENVLNSTRFDVFLLIPGFDLEIESTVSSAPESLRELSRPSGPQRIHDRKPYYVFASLFVIGLLVYYARKFMQSLRKVPVSTATYTPNQIAMRKLAALLDSGIHERDVKRFYIHLTTILRWFIEQKTGIRAPELTTEEFLKEMARRNQDSSPSQNTEDSETGLQSTISLAANHFYRKSTAGFEPGKFEQGKFGGSPPGDKNEQKRSSENHEVPPSDSAAAENTEQGNTEREISREDAFFSERNRTLLAEFLERADLVKFARLQPSTEEVLLGFRRASEFIQIGNQLSDPLNPTFDNTDVLHLDLGTASLRTGSTRMRNLEPTDSKTGTHRTRFS